MGVTSGPDWGLQNFPITIHRGIHCSRPAGKPHPLQGQPLHSCIADLKHTNVLFPLTHSRLFLPIFFFLKAQPQPCTQQKPRASSSPHPGTGPKNSLLPPSSQKLTAQGTLQRKLPSLNTALPTFALLARLASAGPSLLLIPLAAGRAPLSEPERNQQEKAPEGFQQLSK